MSTKIRNLLALLIALSMILGACTTTAEPTVEVVQPTVAEATKAPEPTAVPPTEVPPTPEPAPDLTAIFTEVLAAMPPDKAYSQVSVAKLNEEMADKAPFLVDLREPAEIEKDGYIKDSINIPVRQLLKNLDKLPGLDDAIVVYCASGIRGGIAVPVLRALGYTNVRSLSGGMGAWKKAELPAETGLPAEAAKISTPIVENEQLFIMLDEFLSNMPDGYYLVDAAGLSEALASGTAPTLIDVRSVDEWNKDGYIEGAINIPLPEFMANLDKLPADKAAPIVVYCGVGYRGATALTILRVMGYTNVTNLKGGMGAWKTAQMPVVGWINWVSTWTNYLTNLPDGFYAVGATKLNEEIAEKAPFLLDVREAGELEAKGYIEGAVHIPVREVLKNLDKLPAKDQPIVVYCASGHRGGMVMAALQLLGYTNVRNLGGGLGAWLKAELPVVTGAMPEAPAAGTAPEVDATMLRDLDNFLANMPDGFFAVSPADLNTELAGSPAPVVIDVREATETADSGYIEGSMLMPVRTVLADLTLLPAKDAVIVVTCASGHRGGIVMMALRMMGWTNVRNLGGGVNAWIAAEFPVVK